jgi:hypothetical protein
MISCRSHCLNFLFEEWVASIPRAIHPFIDNSGQNFPFLDADWHYHNSGPEKMRRTNSNFFLAAPYLYI